MKQFKVIFGDTFVDAALHLRNDKGEEVLPNGDEFGCLVQGFNISVMMGELTYLEFGIPHIYIENRCAQTGVEKILRIKEDTGQLIVRVDGESFSTYAAYLRDGDHDLVWFCIDFSEVEVEYAPLPWVFVEPA